MIERIGPYQVQRELGRGGMGVVYLGRDTKLNRPIAIKALPEHFASDPDRLARFEREAKTLASLNLPMSQAWLHDSRTLLNRRRWSSNARQSMS
jgi:serine/threonine protein kinase